MSPQADWQRERQVACNRAMDMRDMGKREGEGLGQDMHPHCGSALACP